MRLDLTNRSQLGTLHHRLLEEVGNTMNFCKLNLRINVCDWALDNITNCIPDSASKKLIVWAVDRRNLQLELTRSHVHQ